MTVALKYDDFEDSIQLMGLEGDGKEMVNGRIEENANKTMIIYILGTHFFYKQPHFPVEPRVAIGSAQNEAQNCYEVANVFWRF